MAKISLSLDTEEILRLLKDDTNDTVKRIFQDSINAVLMAESKEQLNAGRYERTDSRLDCRNGFRERDLKTRVGTITLTVPRHRNQPFKTMVFENYSRSEAALIASMAEMVVNGVSTRKVSQAITALCGTSFSKSTVSELCKCLDERVKEFKERPLTERYPFVTVDATYFRVRNEHRVTSRAMMIAYGTNEHGRREIVGFGVYLNESQTTWTDFLMSLQRRGLAGVILITSDAHEGLRNALAKTFPNVPWQRCQFHFSRNISDKVPKKYQVGIRSELQEMFTCNTIEEARKKRDEVIASYADEAPSAMECLDEGFDSAMTVMALPKPLRKYFRTSNHIERLNKELKRRSRVIGIFPNEASLIRLMGSVLAERHDVLQNTKAVFSPATYQALLNSDVPGQLIKIAMDQLVRAA